MVQIKRLLSTLIFISLFSSGAYAVLGQSSEGKLDDLTCSLELLGATLRGVAENTSFASEKDARDSTAQLPTKHGNWVHFSDAIYKPDSYKAVEPLHGRMVAVILREKNPTDPAKPYRRVVGLFLASLQSGSRFWPGQRDGADSFVVLNRNNLHRLSGGEVVAIYRNNGKSVAITPQQTGNALIDAVPSRAFTPTESTIAGREKSLQDAQNSLQFLPHMGYKKLVFNPEDEPQTAEEFLVGKILAGVCQHPGGQIVIFAGKITQAKSRTTGYGWRDQPETYKTPTRWGITVTIDGSFGKDHGIDFTWCKSLWIHDGTP